LEVTAFHPPWFNAVTISLTSSTLDCAVFLSPESDFAVALTTVEFLTLPHGFPLGLDTELAVSEETLAVSKETLAVSKETLSSVLAKAVKILLRV
jgi:hypothetical protein